MDEEQVTAVSRVQAAMDRGLGDLTPQQALRNLLNSHPLALGTLSEARHRMVLARNSAAAAGRAGRRARDAELSHEHGRRSEDPRGLRRGRFWPTAAVVSALLAVAAAAAFVLCLGLDWPGRIVLVAATGVFGGAVAFVHGRKHLMHGNIAVGLTLMAALLCAAIVALHVLIAGFLSALLVIEAVALGVVLVLTVTAAVLAIQRCESLSCCRLRQRSERARNVSEHLADVASTDQANAVTAASTWESLVVEECRLTRPTMTDSEQWVAECVRIAKLAATPAAALTEAPAVTRAQPELTAESRSSSSLPVDSMTSTQNGSPK